MMTVNWWEIIELYRWLCFYGQWGIFVSGDWFCMVLTDFPRICVTQHRSTRLLSMLSISADFQKGAKGHWTQQNDRYVQLILHIVWSKASTRRALYRFRPRHSCSGEQLSSWIYKLQDHCYLYPKILVIITKLPLSFLKHLKIIENWLNTQK